jgi:hypothetical protein
MDTKSEVIVETGSSIGNLSVEEVTVYTSEGDLFQDYFVIKIDGEVKHPKLTYRELLQRLGHYMGGM